MTEISRRGLFGLFGGLAAAVALAPDEAEAASRRTLVAFGDSYTRSYRAGVPSWADQLHSERVVKVLANFGESNATAVGTNRPRTLDRQVDKWLAHHRRKGLPDRTVVYMGYNDMKLHGSLSGSMHQYRQQVERLIDQGVTKGSRRLLLCLLHDRSRNPAVHTNARDRIKAWNKFVRGVASGRRNVVVVDLFSRFDDVFKNKRAYGLVNVTDPNKSLSARNYLYLDGNHLGRRGQAIIAKEIRRKLG
ncbi:GDSL-type esterase/lipase family protein [Geminicoccus roseus]|uniref:GDSL-type esterase/lipase family protein n=1 Tax=Geminicoccus roseus TaxID=404900 RepID=UPI000417A7ED|nr:GDSL-type esterase/lipase family protein [Geminicoccus roseus]